MPGKVSLNKKSTLFGDDVETVRKLKESDMLIVKKKGDSQLYLMKENILNAEKHTAKLIKELKDRQDKASNLRHNQALLDYSCKVDSGFCSTTYIVRAYYQFVEKDLAASASKHDGIADHEELTNGLYGGLHGISELNDIHENYNDIRPENVGFGLNKQGILRTKSEKWGKNAREIAVNTLSKKDHRQYCSPELYNSIVKKGSKDLNEQKNDVFALGMSVLEAGIKDGVQGCYAKDGFNDAELKRCQDEFCHLHKDANTLLCDMVELCTTTNPHERHTAHELLSKVPSYLDILAHYSHDMGGHHKVSQVTKTCEPVNVSSGHGVVRRVEGSTVHHGEGVVRREPVVSHHGEVRRVEGSTVHHGEVRRVEGSTVHHGGSTVHHGEGVIRREPVVSHHHGEGVIRREPVVSHHHGEGVVRREPVVSSGHGTVVRQSHVSHHGEGVIRREPVVSHHHGEGVIRREPVVSHHGESVIRREPVVSHHGEGVIRREPVVSHHGEGVIRREPVVSHHGEGVIRRVEGSTAHHQGSTVHHGGSTVHHQGVRRVEGSTAHHQGVRRVEGSTAHHNGVRRVEGSTVHHGGNVVHHGAYTGHHQHAQVSRVEGHHHHAPQENVTTRRITDPEEIARLKASMAKNQPGRVVTEEHVQDEVVHENVEVERSQNEEEMFVNERVITPTEPMEELIDN